MLILSGLSPAEIARMTKYQVFAAIQELDAGKSADRTFEAAIQGIKLEDDEEEDGIWI